MYWQVYLHKTALAAELMAKGIMRLIRKMAAEERFGYLAPELEFFIQHNVSIEDFRRDPDTLLEVFTKLDDVSVDYTIKRLQDHFDTPLRFLAGNIISRKLHKIRWSDEPLEDGLINEIRERCIEKYAWSAEITDKLVWTGSETKADYKREDDEIHILMKSGAIRPFSTFLETPVKIAFNRKYYVCHPDIR